MTEIEAIEELEKLSKKYNDVEVEHIKYDELLCEFLIRLGYNKLVKKYNETLKWFA